MYPTSITNNESTPHSNVTIFIDNNHMNILNNISIENRGITEVKFGAFNSSSSDIESIL